MLIDPIAIVAIAFLVVIIGVSAAVFIWVIGKMRQEREKS